VYALWGEPLAAVKQRIADIHDKAAAFGRRPRISVSLRPIIAPTEAQAWERARRILAKVTEHRRDKGPLEVTSLSRRRTPRDGADNDLRICHGRPCRPTTLCRLIDRSR